MIEISILLNGAPVKRTIPPDLTLYVLLEALGAAGLRRGCETECCGCCTVWLDERPVLSCAVIAAQADGRRVTTLEGVRGEADRFIDCLAAEGADQCGYCGAGLMMAVIALKRAHPVYEEAMIRRLLSGNLCRCTGYAAQQRAMKRYWEGSECAK